MMDAVVQHGLWAAVTRLGEAQILLPAFIGGTLWLVFAPHAKTAARLGVPAGEPRRTARESAGAWMSGVVAATGLTTASKVAFLGFGIGSMALDFTGFSGHAMYSMAILPMLAALVGGARGAAVGVLLALVVLVSRVELHAHSWSEALAGAALGAAAAAWALSRYLRRPGTPRAPWWAPLALAMWFTLLPWGAPKARTHDMVIAMSLWLSDRTEPYTRHELLTGQIRNTRWQ